MGTHDTSFRGKVDLPKLYTEREVACYLGVHEITVARWRKARNIACIFVGKSPRYTEEHVIAYLRSHEVTRQELVSTHPKPSAITSRKRVGSKSDLALAHKIIQSTIAK